MLPAFRARLRKMSDAQLAKYGRAAAYGEPGCLLWTGARDVYSATRGATGAESRRRNASLGGLGPADMTLL
jgi:hypothetical protein